jgi:hypothetical protein
VRLEEPIMPLGVGRDARVPGEGWSGIVAVLREALIPQVIAPDLGKGEGGAAFEEEDAFARCGQDCGGDTATRARADHDGVIPCRTHPRTSNPIICHDTASRLPPFSGSP